MIVYVFVMQCKQDGWCWSDLSKVSLGYVCHGDRNWSQVPAYSLCLCRGKTHNKNIRSQHWTL